MFTSFHAVGSGVDARSLLEALNAPAGEFGDREILGLMESLGAKVASALHLSLIHICFTSPPEPCAESELRLLLRRGFSLASLD